jgi:hypothetical protein
MMEIDLGEPPLLPITDRDCGVGLCGRRNSLPSLSHGRLGLVIFAAILLLMGCKRENRIVVYADPWLEDYAVRLKEAFQREYPGVEVKLKVLSSELVGQHLHFGQPMDVFLCFGCEGLPQKEWKQSVQATAPLAGTRVMEIQRRDSAFSAKQAAFGSQHCKVLEASDRPLRRYAESSFGPLPQPDSCTLIANFQSQLEDYMLRGWVSQGYVPAHFMRKAAAGQFVTLRNGPWITSAFTANLMSGAPHAEGSQAFFAFVQSEKSAQILGELGFLP